MRARRFASLLFILAAVACVSWSLLAQGQAPTKTPAPASKPAPAATAAAAKTAAPATKAGANLAQLMRAILFTNSNVIFSAQSHDPAAVKPDDDPSQATDPLKGQYGGWQAVENSSLAIAEAANLLAVPRMCSNGKPAPIHNADWIKYVDGLRAAGLASYKAAQSKRQDAIVDVSDTVTTACANCHDVYREKTPAQGGLAARCTK